LEQSSRRPFAGCHVRLKGSQVVGRSTKIVSVQQSLDAGLTCLPEPDPKTRMNPTVMMTPMATVNRLWSMLLYESRPGRVLYKNFRAIPI